MGSNNNENSRRNNPKAPAQAADDRSNNTDPRGAIETATQHQVNRFEDQQGPLANNMAYNYGRGSEANYGDYTDIMNQYRGIASGGGSSGGGGGGGGGGGYTPQYSAFTVTPERVKPGQSAAPERVTASDPFQSYGGYQEFSKTGGYSDQDMANMRARGVAPIRAAYANAERNIGQQRSLQGGYTPNAIAAQGRMAREQGQAGADASTNVEANLAQMRQQGRLAGLGGMQGIEGQRLGAQMQGDIFNSTQAMNNNQFNVTNALDADKYNAGLNYQGQTYNADANTQAQARNNAAAQQSASDSANAAAANTQDRLAALRGMTTLYGTNPGMSETFGNQALSAVNSGANFGLGVLGRDIQGQGLPGQFDQTMDRINTTAGLVNSGMQAGGQIYDAAEQRRRANQQVDTRNFTTSQNDFDQ